ncbi:MAG: PD40 domain-containing protein, partial [Bacteroidetes bacterium]|nr:PD40 domain-containing protein [Bacteroidota bacterium]
DLKEAITLFESLIKTYPNEKEYAAKAQYFIGLCYEKSGLKEAQKAYQKVLDNYPEQTEAVKLANEKLSILTRAKEVIKKDDEQYKLSKIYSGLSYPSSISPDGKKLALLKSEDWDIYLMDIVTKEEVRLTNEHNSIRDISWSPDSKMIAFIDIPGNIYVVPTRGGPSKMVIKADPEAVKAKDGIGISGWTSDSKKLLFQVPSRGLFAILVSGGEWEEIMTFQDPQKARQYGAMTLSLNGKFIAYDFTQNNNKDIYVMTVDGSESVRITKNPAQDSKPQWSINGCWMGFYSNRTDRPEAWAIKITPDGKPDGMPFQVTRGGVLEANWAKDGKAGYSCAVRTEHIYIVNPDGTDEFQLTKFPAFNKVPRWSPDGKMIAFASDYDQSLNTFRIWTVPSKGGEAKLIADAGWEYAWSRDGKMIAFVANPNSPIISIVPAEGGEPKELVAIDGDIGNLDWSPDRKRIVFSYSITPKEYSNITDLLRERLSGISIILADGGKPKKLITAEKKGVVFWSPRWSPDGKKIAFRTYNQNAREEGGEKEIYLGIWTIDAEGGEPKLIANLKRDGYHLCWTPDGKYIVYEERIKGMDFELCKVSAEGGEPEKMNIRGRSAACSPDGKKIAYSRRLEGYYEFWLVENFLPETKVKQ